MTRRAWAVLVALGLAGCISTGCTSAGSDDDPAGPPVTGSSAVPGEQPGACRTTYPASPLPEWAGAGFSAPEPSVPHVLGDAGDIVAIVWVAEHPLSAPPQAGKNNKILWVARTGAADGPLVIRATSARTGETVSRTVEPAPGPSVVDLPSPGCWSFDLAWGGHHDHLRLGYAAG